MKVSATEMDAALVYLRTTHASIATTLHCSAEAGDVSAETLSNLMGEVIGYRQVIALFDATLRRARFGCSDDICVDVCKVMAHIDDLRVRVNQLVGATVSLAADNDCEMESSAVCAFLRGLDRAYAAGCCFLHGNN